MHLLLSMPASEAKMFMIWPSRENFKTLTHSPRVYITETFVLFRISENGWVAEALVSHPDPLKSLF